MNDSKESFPHSGQRKGMSMSSGKKLEKDGKSAARQIG
jgi:hypothetical protein